MTCYNSTKFGTCDFLYVHVHMILIVLQRIQILIKILIIKNYYLFPSLFFKASKHFCIPEHDHDFYRPQQTYDIENPGYGLGQAQKSGWVKPVNR